MCQRDAPQKYPDETVMLSLEDSKHTVRCCNDKGNGCISEPCQSGKTYQEAVEHCSNQGRRLCFRHEINRCCGTGCQFDHTTNWIADSVEGIAQSFIYMINWYKLLRYKTIEKLFISKGLIIIILYFM